MQFDSIKLAKTPGYDNKIGDIGIKTANIPDLASTTALTAAENKIPSVNDIYVKIKRENIYITLTDYNKFTKDIFDSKIREM